MSRELETQSLKARPLEAESKRSSWLGIGAVLAAVGASLCCVGPLVLLSLGIGGAWMSALTSLETFRPFFIILTLIFIGLGFRQLYLVPKTCEAGQACASPQVKRNQKILFWVGSALLLGLIAFPWYAPLFME